MDKHRGIEFDQNTGNLEGWSKKNEEQLEEWNEVSNARRSTAIDRDVMQNRRPTNDAIQKGLDTECRAI